VPGVTARDTVLVPGDVWLVFPRSRSGADNVLIVQNPLLSPVLSTVLVVPLLPVGQVDPAPSVIALPTEFTSFDAHMAAVCHKMTWVRQAELVHRLGSVSSVGLSLVYRAIRLLTDSERPLQTG
jgi:mRNA-degrading endonuclease toxin of MazEF toxin-antitoxin module